MEKFSISLSDYDLSVLLSNFPNKSDDFLRSINSVSNSLSVSLDDTMLIFSFHLCDQVSTFDDLLNLILSDLILKLRSLNKSDKSDKNEVGD